MRLRQSEIQSKDIVKADALSLESIWEQVKPALEAQMGELVTRLKATGIVVRDIQGDPIPEVSIVKDDDAWGVQIAIGPENMEGKSPYWMEFLVNDAAYTDGQAGEFYLTFGLYLTKGLLPVAEWARPEGHSKPYYTTLEGILNSIDEVKPALPSFPQYLLDGTFGALPLGHGGLTRSPVEGRGAQ